MRVQPPVRGALLAALVALVAMGLSGAGVAAHPADRLVQHLVIGLTPDEARVSIAIGGGMLANELVLDDLDPNGDGTVAEAESRAWLAAYLDDMHLFVDNVALPVDPARSTLTVPDPEQFHLGLSPLIVAFAVPVPATNGKAEHRLVVRIDHMIDRTDFRRDVSVGAGVDLLDTGWPSRTTRIAFEADPALAGAGGEVGAAAAEWGGGGVIGKAKELLERPKTPVFLLSLLAIFVLMGALHAVQPGHGKTLVAAYLVATGGTPRDALTLAGVVTFTHTISVFALGFATLAASQVFLPSRVMPVLSLISGLLVVGMGLMMLGKAARGGRRKSLPRSRRGAEGGGRGVAALTSHHPSPTTHHHHDHDHEGLSEEEHARLHLAEVEAAMAEETGGRRVSMRNLIVLGVSGGLVPCPDALAILLLAVAINQLMFGMLAIVAFSVGLAGVLVAFGLAIALAGPFWSRASRAAGTGDRLRWARAGFGRLVAASPVVSAAFVLLLGLTMLWRGVA